MLVSQFVDEEGARQNARDPPWASSARMLPNGADDSKRPERACYSGRVVAPCRSTGPIGKTPAERSLNAADPARGCPMDTALRAEVEGRLDARRRGAGAGDRRPLGRRREPSARLGPLVDRRSGPAPRPLRGAVPVDLPRHPLAGPNAVAGEAPAAPRSRTSRARSTSSTVAAASARRSSSGRPPATSRRSPSSSRRSAAPARRPSGTSPSSAAATCARCGSRIRCSAGSTATSGWRSWRGTRSTT